MTCGLSRSHMCSNVATWPTPSSNPSSDANPPCRKKCPLGSANVLPLREKPVAGFPRVWPARSNACFTRPDHQSMIYATSCNPYWLAQMLRHGLRLALGPTWRPVITQLATESPRNTGSTGSPGSRAMPDIRVLSDPASWPPEKSQRRPAQILRREPLPGRHYAAALPCGPLRIGAVRTASPEMCGRYGFGTKFVLVHISRRVFSVILEQRNQTFFVNCSHHCKLPVSCLMGSVQAFTPR